MWYLRFSHVFENNLYEPWQRNLVFALLHTLYYMFTPQVFGWLFLFWFYLGFDGKAQQNLTYPGSVQVLLPL